MEERLLVGEILKPQGIRGEVKVRPFTDSADDFKQFKKVVIDETEYKILSARSADGCVFLGFRGVPDRNAAELLRGKNIYLLREDAPQPKEGSYYIVDLLGSRVVTETGKELGTLLDVRQAATDIYTLDMGGKEVLFPVAKGVVLSVDVEEKIITVDEKRFYEVAVLS